MPSFDDSREQRANIAQSEASAANLYSAANLNNSQANRINALLPGEMRQQGLEAEGQQLQNEGIGITNEGNKIINILNQKKAVEQDKRNSILDVELKYADQNAKLDMQVKQEEIRLRRAQISQAAAITRNQLAQMDTTRRQEAGYIYPRVHATMSRVYDLMESGDIPGANKLYQVMLQSLPEWFQQYEGKGGVALIGDTIDQEDSLDTVRDFRDYTGMLVSPDSQMGQLQKQDAADEAAMARQKVAAQATVDSAIARATGSIRKDAKTELDIQKKAEDIVAERLTSSILQGKYSGGNYTNRAGRPVEPVVASGMNMIKDKAVQIKTYNPNIPVEERMSTDFTTGDLDGPGLNNLSGVVLPNYPKMQVKFQEIFSQILEQQNIPAEDAYKKTMSIFLQQYTKSRFPEYTDEQ